MHPRIRHIVKSPPLALLFADGDYHAARKPHGLAREHLFLAVGSGAHLQIRADVDHRRVWRDTDPRRPAAVGEHHGRMVCGVEEDVTTEQVVRAIKQ